MAKGLIEVLNDQGLTLYDRGQRKVAHCPLHEGDESPSFTVYETDTYYCFGCKKWGDAYKFLLEKGWPLASIKEYLGEDYVMKVRAKPRVIKVKSNKEITQLLDRAATTYNKFLWKAPAPLQYLLERGISESSIQRHKLGFTDGYTLKIRSQEEAELGQRIGLLNSRGGEMMAHRITIPNFYGDDRNQTCDFIVGRTIINDKTKYLGVKLPKPLYGFWYVRQSSIIFVAEGQFDWLTLRQWGYPAVVLGGSQITPQNLETLRNKRVVIVPDNDESGQKMAEQLKDQLPSAVVLDYSTLGVKDVAELAVRRDGQDAFNFIVKEQVEWLTSISEMTWSRYFQGSTLQRHLALT